jgi:hypothetical protein
MLGYRPPEETRAFVKKVIGGVARDGGYILDASAIMQNDTKIENLQAMVEAAHEFGVYSSSPNLSPAGPAEASPDPREGHSGSFGLESLRRSKTKPGVCVPWEKKKGERPEISGDEELCRRIWESVDSSGNMFIWQCLLSF